MRLTALRLLACFSIAGVCVATFGSTRPRYGGTLAVAMHEAFASIEPGAAAGSDAERLTALVFDTLVTEADDGAVQPGLARAWSSDATFNRWQFWLRRNVIFHDGQALTPELVAANFADSISGCRTTAVGDSVVFQCASPEPALAAEMTSPLFAVARRDSSGKLQGTGPFVLSEFEPGKRAVFTAFERCWAGRPYLDSIEVAMGQDFRDQALALQLGRADVVEIADNERSAGARLVSSAPESLVALLFSHGASSAGDARLREAAALAIDRAAIAGILLQGRAEAATSLLPNWISGYAPLLAEVHDPARARQLKRQFQAQALSLAVASADPQLRLIAERVALNLRDVGFNVQLTSDVQHSDAQLALLPLGSADPEAALANLAAAVREPLPELRDDSLDAAFRAERDLLRGFWVVPIAHLARTWALSLRVKNWSDRQDGQWRLGDVWLEPPAQGAPRR